MRDYARIVRTPNVGGLLAAAMLSRVQVGIDALAVILFLKEQLGSYAAGGLVAGALSLGTGVGAPVHGRLVDRHGVRAVVIPVAVLHCVALGGLVTAGYAGGPVALIAAFGLVAGFATPPTSAVLRSLWPVLLRGEPRLVSAAYALDTVLIELVFIAGPLIAAGLAALVAPAAALAVSAVGLLVGATAFSLSPLVRSRLAARDGERHFFGAALRAPGIRMLVLTAMPAGFCFGATEVALPAFSDAEGSKELAGVLLAVWAAASAVAGLLYGVRPRRRHISAIHLRLTCLLPLGYLPLAAASSVPVMALLLVAAGATVAPLIASRNELVGSVAPADARTEAYTWPVTAMVGGIALGASAAGALVEGPGWRTAFLAAAAAATLGALLGVLGRRALQPAA